MNDPVAAPPAASRRESQPSADAILKAATEEFARHGLAGARVDKIAESAGVNKRMLYYYFGQKEDLFLAVLEAAYANIRTEEQKLNLTEIEPVEAIRRLVAFTWKYHRENPEFIPLLNNENLYQAIHLKRSEKILSLHTPFVSMLDEILQRGKRDGLFRDGVDPVQLYISIAGLAFFYLSNRFTLSAIFDRDFGSQREQLSRLSHMTDLVLGYLVKL